MPTFKDQLSAFKERWTTAISAGSIVAKCTTGCYLDNVEETVVPCPVHAEEIARLAAINEANR